MGDSICFRVDILRQLGWGAGLTDDYQMRQKLLLKDILITYEPAAKGYGEAPLTWAQARAQRARWLRGTRDVSQQFGKNLLTEGLKRRNLAMLDGALQGSFPSFSTLCVLSLAVLMILVPINFYIKSVSLWLLIGAWAAVVGTLLIYPLVGLALENAPTKAYLAIMFGPFFILWRTWLAILVQFSKKRVTWVRTEHGNLK
jgi:cellulose synthase/poly-beta-1,6-N-acetylglucosamine synthase-like glycosyltransferase